MQAGLMTWWYISLQCPSMAGMVSPSRFSHILQRTQFQPLRSPASEDAGSGFILFCFFHSFVCFTVLHCALRAPCPILSLCSVEGVFIFPLCDRPSFYQSSPLATRRPHCCIEAPRTTAFYLSLHRAVRNPPPWVSHSESFFNFCSQSD